MTTFIRWIAALVLVPMVAACGFDLIGPDSLQLARAARVALNLSVSDRPSASCEGDMVTDSSQAHEQFATLCLWGDVFPGRTALGEQLDFLDETLEIAGHLVFGIRREDGTIRFSTGLRLPLASLPRQPVVLRIPILEAAPDLEPFHLRFVGRSQQDTLWRDPYGAVRIEIILPDAVQGPQPAHRQWNMLLGGTHATATYLGAGTPPPVFEFAPAAFEQAGGTVFDATFRWIQQYTGYRHGVEVGIFSTQTMGWTVLTVGSEDGPGAGS